jgi:hypothetical protein
VRVTHGPAFYGQEAIMSLSTRDLVEAKENIAALLDELDLEGYLFEVEPEGDDWRVRIECATAGNWCATTLRVNTVALLAAQREEDARQRLLADWRTRLTTRAAP